MSTISSTITNYVYLGQNGYTSPLLITNTGEILSSHNPALVMDSGTVINDGVITGNDRGVNVKNGVFIDDGAITAKYQIVTYNYGGGNPTLLFESGATISNKLFAHGHTSTLGVTGSTPFTLSDASGFWQNFAAFTFASNSGGFALTGAASVFDGGEAISGLIGGDRVTLTGFAATSESFASANELVLKNSANATVTLDLTGFTSTGQLKFSNDGSNTTITGLTGTISTAISPGITAGAGIYLSTLLITNTGAVTGGGGSNGTNGGYAFVTTGGGVGGIALAGGIGGSIVNQGLLTGGAGGSGGDGRKSVTPDFPGLAGGAGGNGGAGLILASGTGTNQLLITGGIGGAGGTGGWYDGGVADGFVVDYYSGGSGGAGGAGLSLSNAAVFTNSGTITGGGGGLGGLNGSRTVQRGRAGSGAQGAGAYVTGATLVNAGSISGSNAVVFGASAGTLVVESGAVFNGNILANSAVADVLEFSGSSATEFSGIGTSTEGFTHISFAAGAAWTIEGNASGLASGQSITGFAAGDRIILDNVAASSETLNAGKLTLGGAVLALGASSDNFVVVDNGTNSTLAVAPASISLAAGSTDIISGHAAGLTASSITGFARGDTIELEGFAATSETYVSGVGLVLGNGTSFDTLAVNSFSSVFVDPTDGTNTTIFAGVSIISTAISPGITAGAGSYSSTLLINNTGAITGSGGAGGSNSEPEFGGSEANPTNGGTGGLALSAGSGASITNQGAITGGAGGRGGSDYASSTGYVATGAAGGAGAAGVSLSGAMITNAGNIAGGAGGAGGNGASDTFNFYHSASGGGAGGAGGDGLDLSAGSGANQGVITGGQGGSGGTGGRFLSHYYYGRFGYRAGGNGGGGGNGLVLSGGANFTNTGTIKGGAGGAGGGASGTGAYVLGGTLVNAGTISGSNAVVVGANVVGTLVVESGAVFNGNILANSAVADVLEFAGSSATEFSGIGTSTEGFTHISFAAGAAWTLEGNTSGLASGQSITGFAAGDRIILDNVAASSETLNAGKLTLGGAVLALGASSDNFVVVDNGTNSTIAVAPSSISLAAGGSYNVSGHAAVLTASSITGFAPGDTIDLEGFAATSETYVSGVGLVLGNGTSFDTLAVNSFSGFFAERTDGTNTTIFASAPVSIISTSLAAGITLNSATYANPLTVSSTGSIPGLASSAAVTSFLGESLTNQGQLKGGAGPAGAYGYYNGGTGAAGGDGLDGLSSAMLSNTGTIAGGAGGVGGSSFDNGGAAGQGGGGLGVAVNATMTNAGLIQGGAGGAGAYSFYNGGTGAAGGDGLDGLSSAMLSNTGTIAGGVGGAGGGGFYNGAAGGQGGGGLGVAVNATITNAGLIQGGAGGSGGYAVYYSRGYAFYTGGAAGQGGVGLLLSVNATITNAGTITGGAGGDGGAAAIGGNGGAGGTAIQAADGLIDNTGLIQGGAGGSAGNAPGGSGSAGGAGGVAVSFGGGTLIDAGVIEGGSGADAVDFGANAATLVVEAGASFIGNVVANAAVADVLEFAGGALGLGGSFTGFSEEEILSGALVTLAGTLFSAVENDGTVDVDGASLVIAGALTGTGLLIDDPSDIVLDGSVAAGQTISFTGTGGVVELGDPAQFNGTIVNFIASDTLAIDGFTVSAETYATGQLVLDGVTSADAPESLTLNIAGSFASSDFDYTTGPSGNTELTTPICYLHGTRILTPTGQVAVEDLRAGDAVVTRFGGIQRIKWLGRQSYAPAFIAEDKYPVRIAAGALAEGVPAKDLTVSPGHSMLLGDVLVLAANLVNGVTVTQARPSSEVNYVQLDLGRHDCVLAEGAWSETYADAPGLRAQFHNAAEYEALFPDEPPVEELRLCAPRPERGPRLAAALGEVEVLRKRSLF